MQVGEARCAPRAGVLIGSGMGGLTIFQDGVKNLVEKGYKKITPFFIPYAITNMCARAPRHARPWPARTDFSAGGCAGSSGHGGAARVPALCRHADTRVHAGAGHAEAAPVHAAK
jgi:hypothetical protein